MLQPIVVWFGGRCQVVGENVFGARLKLYGLHLGWAIRHGGNCRSVWTGADSDICLYVYLLSSIGTCVSRFLALVYNTIQQ